MMRRSLEETLKRRAVRGVAIAAALLIFPSMSVGATQGRWPNTVLARVEILALIQSLNAELLASRSATVILEKWCGDHGMADEPRIVARRIEGIEKPASEDTRRRLRVESGEAVKYRRVKLLCGDHVLSEADNWYAPARLPQEANRLLETTETPFGKAVQALQPSRRTFDVKMLWSPLPKGWETGAANKDKSAGGSIEIPREIFTHRAILYAGDQTPFSEVEETYTSDILDFEMKTTAAPPNKDSVAVVRSGCREAAEP